VPAAATSPIDWPDWMNPILVKELRQSLRSRWFEIIFLWLIGSLCLITAIGAEHGSPRWITFLFWLDVGITLHLLLPMHSALSASDDRQRGNFELIRVTGLTAEKMVVHRVAALFFYSAMTASLVLPFVVLRYFLGGIELIDELQYLVLLTLGCPVLGGTLLWLMATSGLTRLMLSMSVAFLLVFYESFTIAAAFATGSEAVVGFVFWIIGSFIGWIVSQAFASESFLLSNRRA